MPPADQAVILAAGEGQRLRPFTVLKPKVMLPIANKPILSYVIEAAAGNGIRDIIIVVGYKKEQIQDYFGSGERFGVNITYIAQKHQIGTGQALKTARNALRQRFLVLPGDNIIEPATIAAISGPPEADAVLIKRSGNVSRYGMVVVEDGAVRKITEKPREAGSNLVSTGIYLLDRHVFDYLGAENDLPVVLQNMISDGIVVRGVETGATWLDVVYPWDILTLNGAALMRIQSATGGTIEPGCTIKGPVAIGTGSTVRANSYIVGPAVIGEGCEIGPSVCILPSTSIGDNATILPFGYLSNCVIGAGVRIDPGCFLHNSVVGAHATLGGRFTARSGLATMRVDGEFNDVTMGAMIGDYCEIEDGVVIQPGVVIGNFTRVRPLKIVSENTADRSQVV